MRKILLIFFIVLFFVSANAQKMTFIQPNNNKIKITGAFFIKKDSNKVIIDRFDKNIYKKKGTYLNPKKANTQSGAAVLIKTNSPKIIFHFSSRTDAKGRFGNFAVYKNNKFFKYIKCGKDNNTTSFVIDNNKENEWVQWKILLPRFAGLNFMGIEITNDSEIKPIKSEEKKVYVAIGNSITHGAGQKAPDQTYPYLLAKKKNWKLYNLGVGGSKISWTVADMIKNKEIDVITVLWGYNDWNVGYTLEGEIISRYTRLLKLLLENHKDAQIYCILPTFTKRKKSKKGGALTIDEIRNAEEKIAKEFQNKGYENLHIIKAYEFTDADGLNDIVHFNTKGASKFANKLAEIINIK